MPKYLEIIDFIPVSYVCWQLSQSRTDRKSPAIRTDVMKSEILNSTNKSHPDLCSAPEKYFRTALWARARAHTYTHSRASVLFSKRDRADVVIESSGRTRAMVRRYRGGSACSAGINSVAPL